MTQQEFLAASGRASQWIARYFDEAGGYPVLSRVKPGEIAAALPATAPEQGEPMEALLADFEQLIVPGLTHWNHPRFFAYFANTGSQPGVIADMLAAAINVNAMLWRASPAATELEQITMNWLREWLGLPPEFFGIIYDTATTSTFHAIITARQRIAPECRAQGHTPGLVMYTSAQANLSVERAAIAAGIGLNNVRKVPLDAEFRMDAAELARMIAEDRAAGLRPFCVVAATGTTATAAIDPVAAIADLCQCEDIWLHVDAAYGGAYAVVEEMRHTFEGWQRADSIVVNPHKGLGTPVDLSAYYTRHAAVQRQAFALTPDYIATPTGEENLTDYGMPLGRRFRALKLWFVMCHYGRQGMQAILRGQLAAARELAAWVAADARFELAAPVTYTLVCFRLKAGNEASQALLEAINQSGEALLSSTVLNGKFTLRLAIGNFATTLEDVRRTWQAMQLAADPILRS